MICVSVFAGVYVVGFSTEEVENNARGNLRHIERDGDTGGIHNMFTILLN